MKQILSVSNLRFSWGENQVLKDINFKVNANQLIAVLGVNGAGKSTLIKCINGILKPDVGEISVLGEDVADLGLIEVAKKMSYVPQNVQTNFPMEVFDVVLLGRRPHISWSVNKDDRDKKIYS